MPHEITLQTYVVISVVVIVGFLVAINAWYWWPAWRGRKDEPVGDPDCYYSHDFGDGNVCNNCQMTRTEYEGEKFRKEVGDSDE